MRFRIIKAYFKKEIIELVRTKMIFMPYLIPLLIVILFGYGIKTQVIGARILIIDNDKTTISHILISKFEHSKYFNTEVKDISEKEALSSIKKASKDVIIIIPESFEKNIIKGTNSEIGIFVDASFPTRATTIYNYVQATILDLAQDIMINSDALITLNNRNLFNQALRDEEMIVPGLLGLVLLINPAVLTALFITKEKEKGTIFNFYSSSITKAEFLLSKLSSLFVLISLNVFFLFLVVMYVFNLPFRGDFFLYWLSSEIYIIISLGMGLLVSIISSTQIIAVILALLFTIIPGFLYSGMLMPISSMSGEAYYIAHLYPVMYYNHIIYDVFLIGQGFDSPKIISYLFLLIAYAVAFFILGMFFLKKEIK